MLRTWGALTRSASSSSIFLINAALNSSNVKILVDFIRSLYACISTYFGVFFTFEFLKYELEDPSISFRLGYSDSDDCFATLILKFQGTRGLIFGCLLQKHPLLPWTLRIFRHTVQSCVCGRVLLNKMWTRSINQNGEKDHHNLTWRKVWSLHLKFATVELATSAAGRSYMTLEISTNVSALRYWPFLIIFIWLIILSFSSWVKLFLRGMPLTASVFYIIHNSSFSCYEGI